MITPSEIQKLIVAGIPDARVEVKDMTGTGDHFEIAVVSRAFGGKPVLEQHRMVFSILEKEMQDRIHAVKLKTRTP
ncbi:MAG: BolA family transcriptional regulator [Candidatus Omnitrophica bacterium]|nr:BolA family transcriptional regulator [Candidatus Omnitrophota bacterium]